VNSAAAPMTEAQARALLRDCDGQGGVEAWIAGQRWRPAGDGWEVEPALQVWRFRLVPDPPGLQVIASPGSGAAPAVWTVATRARS
jgi:hypothetical protein